MERILKYTINYGHYDTASFPDDVLVISKGDGDRRGSRFYKINSHLLPPHDISIYFDANVTFKKDITQLVDTMNTDWLAFLHPERDCLYQEAQVVSGLYANAYDVDRQVHKYRQQNMPEHFGLFANYCIIRKNTERVKEINQKWWLEYQNGCVRDQVSLPYVFWEQGYFPQCIYDDYIIRGGHTANYGQK